MDRACFQLVVVDDCEADRYLLRRVIESQHKALSLVEFSNPDAAIAGLLALDARDDVSELVLMLDINMPGMDGFELLEKLDFCLSSNLDWSVAFVTSSSDPQEQRRAERSPRVFDFLTKPVSKKRFSLMLKRASDLRDTQPPPPAADKGR